MRKAKTVTKAGTSSGAAERRRERFVAAYLANGNNGTKAAIAAGFSEKGAAVQSTRLLKDPKILQDIALHAKEVASIAGLDTQRTLQEVARVGYNDSRQFYRTDGTLKPVSEWSPDMAAAVASLEVEELEEGSGENRKVVGRTKKLKLWDKNAALEKAMKHHGLYERDNSQRGESLSVTVKLL